ncbi:hypothetical protein LXA43DRAFT_1101691 [Ganoderma leucocontextum]|nr:hypothetical protein LXA43DRAFT_1101691 [Ganoderma leucocontextum]
MESDANASLSDRFSTIGIGYLGVVVTSIIYGITCIQAFQYYRSPRSNRDSPSIKYLVAVLWALDSIQEAFAVHVFYFFLVDGFTNPASSEISIWSIPGGILLNAFVQLLVKTFYAVRIFKISRNYYVAATIGILNVTRFGKHWTSFWDHRLTVIMERKSVINHPIVLNVYWPAFFFSRSSTLSRSDITFQLRYIGSIGLGLEAATGILISASGVFELLKRRSDLRSRGNDIISRLVMLTIATGSLSALFVIADFVAYVIAPTEFYVLFFNMLIAKLDINALLTSLNCRDFILRVEESSTAISLSMPVFVRHTELSSTEHGPNSQSAILGKDSGRMLG